MFREGVKRQIPPESRWGTSPEQWTFFFVPQLTEHVCAQRNRVTTAGHDARTQHMLKDVSVIDALKDKHVYTLQSAAGCDSAACFFVLSRNCNVYSSRT